jgi:hypothetical protein
MGIEKRLQEASRRHGYPEDYSDWRELCSEALSAIYTLKNKLTAAEACAEKAERERDEATAKSEGIEADAIIQRILDMSDEEILRLTPKEQLDADVLSGKLALANARVIVAERERDAALAAFKTAVGG